MVNKKPGYFEENEDWLVANYIAKHKGDLISACLTDGSYDWRNYWVELDLSKEEELHFDESKATPEQKATMIDILEKDLDSTESTIYECAKYEVRDALADVLEKNIEIFDSYLNSLKKDIEDYFKNHGIELDIYTYIEDYGEMDTYFRIWTLTIWKGRNHADIDFKVSDGAYREGYKAYVEINAFDYLFYYSADREIAYYVEKELENLDCEIDLDDLIHEIEEKIHEVKFEEYKTR